MAKHHKKYSNHKKAKRTNHMMSGSLGQDGTGAVASMGTALRRQQEQLEAAIGRTMKGLHVVPQFRLHLTAANWHNEY